MELDLTVKRAALRWHGSKFRLAPWIVGFFPEHTTFVEPFGGGASVLIRKPRSRIEIYNDLDSDIVNFFAVLRDAAGRAKLAEQLSLTPYSREEFRACFIPSAEPIERARRLVARSFMGFASHSHNIENVTNGWRSERTDGRQKIKQYALEWLGVPMNCLAVAERFRGVTIEHLHAFDLIPKYDHAETLYYIDPPYVHGERDDLMRGYAHEMSDHEHRQLAWLLHGLKGKVVLSGYDSRLYRSLYSDWHREQITARANGQKGSSERVEVIWMNFKPVNQPTN
jgi:DNA adenine methylase